MTWGTRLSVLLGVAFAVAWLFLLRPVNLGGPASYIIVSGTSMEPTYYTGDFVMTLKHDSYGTGDIVAFYVNENIVIHRITGGDGVTGYTLQGDNKAYADTWHPTNEQVLGSAYFHMAGFGKFMLQVRQPMYFAGIVGLIFLAMFGPWVLDMVRKDQWKHKRKYANMLRRRERMLAKYMSMRTARMISRLDEF